MPDSKSTFTVDSPTNDSSSISVSSLTTDSSTLLPDDLKLTQTGSSYFGRLDTISTPDFSIGASGDTKLIFGGSAFPVTSGQTVYLGSGIDATEVNARISLIACTVKQIQVSSSAAPGTGQSFAYTVMKNGSADRTFTVTVSNSNQSGSVTDSTGTAFSNGDYISVKLVTSGSAATAHHSFSIKIE